MDSKVEEVLANCGLKKAAYNGSWFKQMLDGRVEICFSNSVKLGGDNAKQYCISFSIDGHPWEASLITEKQVLGGELKMFLSKMCRSMIDDMSRIAQAVAEFDMTGM